MEVLALQLIRFAPPDGRSGADDADPSRAALVGLRLGERVSVLEGVDRLGQLWSLTAGELRSLLDSAAGRDGTLPAESLRLLAPVDGRSEVWACGVTYEISREARVEESQHAASVYERVYDAARPELFFKSAAWRVAGPGESIAVRDDSTLDVPEPEVALVVNRFGEIVGVTACNDVSSRSIEGENPLYLPQAKTYLGGCALGPAILPIWEVPDPYELAIELTIERGGAVAWHGATSTAQLHRRYEELVEHLFRADRHPEGAVLSTGTCLVPEAPFSLVGGDIVSVSVAGVGTLRNTVVRGVGAVESAASPELASALAAVPPGARTAAGEHTQPEATTALPA